MIFLEYVGSRASLSAEDEEGKKLPSALEQLFSLFIFCKARRRRAGMCDHREQIPRRERHPVTSARGCATTGSKSPGESIIPSHPHVDVLPPGANSFRRSHRKPCFPYSFGRSRTFEGVSSGHCQPLSKTDTMPLCRKCVQASGIILRYIPP